MSNEKKQSLRIGNGKKRKENWLTASICLDKLSGHVYEFQGKKYVNLNINIKEQPDQYGKDVEISINDYKPNNVSFNNNQGSKVSMNTNYAPVSKQVIDEEPPF